MVITVQCPECATSFPVDPAKVPLGGVKARCSSCSAVFRVERPDEAVPPPPPPAVPLEEPDDAPPSAGDLEVEDQLAQDASAEEPEEPEEPSEPASWEGRGVAVVETSEAPVALESTDDWVFETEEDIDPDSLQIEPVGTLEESLEGARDEVSSFGSDLTQEAGMEVVDTEEGSPLDAELALEESREEGAEDALAEPIWEPVPPPVAGPESESEEAAAAIAEPAPASAVTGFTFGRRDPHDKARRLARVLVSDIITYNPDRHHRALSAGSLKEDFEEEIEKSWKEYVEQVGPDIARNTPYWSQALNDVLARGQQIF